MNSTPVAPLECLETRCLLSAAGDDAQPNAPDVKVVEKNLQLAVVGASVGWIRGTLTLTGVWFVPQAIDAAVKAGYDWVPHAAWVAVAGTWLKVNGWSWKPLIIAEVAAVAPFTLEFVTEKQTLRSLIAAKSQDLSDWLRVSEVPSWLPESFASWVPKATIATETKDSKATGDWWSSSVDSVWKGIWGEAEVKKTLEWHWRSAVPFVVALAAIKVATWGLFQWVKLGSTGKK